MKDVEVHGKNARLVLPKDGDSPSVQWIENGLMISINGPLKKEAMLKVAESMKRAWMSQASNFMEEVGYESVQVSQ